MERLPDVSPLYIPPILLMASSIWSSVNELPNIPSTNVRLTVCMIGEPSKLHSLPSQVLTLTDSIFPPSTDN